MSAIILNRATNALSKYYGLYTLDDLAQNNDNSSVNTSSDPTISNNNSSFTELTKIQKQIIRLLINTSEGGMTTQNLLTTLTSYVNNDTQAQNELNNTIKIFYGKTTLPNARSEDEDEDTNPSVTSMLGNTRNERVNKNLNSCHRSNPNLSLIQVNHCGITPASKNVNAVTIFLNGIPSIELSRALPYINIEFQFSRSPVDSNNRAQTLSIFKLLEGAKQVSQGSTDRSLLDGPTTDTEIAGQPQRHTATAGMELFTSPQTMVNANSADDRNLRSNPILDKFRPFLTLKQLQLDVVPSGGLMSFKSGKLEFVLHDSSRLAEIADFISPDLYGGTEIYLEYGWIHPDGPEQKNNFADVINGMRCKEKYGIYNSSFAFDDHGQVQVTLQIAMRGGQEFRTETISDHGSDENIQNVTRRINDLQTSIGELRRQRNQNRPPGAREIRGVTILDAAEDASSNLVLSADLNTALRQFQNDVHRAATNNETLRNLGIQIAKLYGHGRNPNGGTQPVPLASQLRSNVRNSIREKFEAMGIIDPFVTLETSQTNQGTNSGASRNGQRSNSARAPNNNAAIRTEDARSKVSLGKLLLLFIGSPLAGSGKYDDVQLIFYPFNSYAGHARDKNISQFTVDKNYFINQYAQFRLSNVSRTANVQLRDFLGFVAATIIDDSAAESYGLRAFRHRDTGTGDNQTTVSEPMNANAATTQIAVDNALRNGNGFITPDGSFRMPQIDFYIECIPEDPTKIPDPQDTRQDGNHRLKSILRIHIFDRHNTGYDSQGALLAAMRDDTIMHLTTPDATNAANPGVATSHNQVAANIINRAVNDGIIKPINPPTTRSSGPESIDFPTGVYESALSPRSIKEFVMKTMPYIIKGAGGTAVKHAALSSMHDPALTTVNMLRSFRATSLEPNGERPGGLPLQVIPCELGMTTFGCPLIEFAQQFFIDMQTGTTADNIYGVNGLTHTIRPGSFDTEVKFIPLDAFSRYLPLIQRLGTAANVMNEIQNNSETAGTSPGAGNTGRRV